MMKSSAITNDELNSLKSLLHLATGPELSRIQQLLKPLESPIRKYCPHKPWPKQELFLNLQQKPGSDCLEALYGGAGGGGKTDALLMAALQYVHVPGYSALILRRDTMRLSLPKAILDRSREWLANSDAKWNEQKKTWRFPTSGAPATIQFGYIDNPQDKFRYASAEFQLIIWEELTEFRLSEDEGNPYLFMFSRLRKPTSLNVPLRVLSATNPGNIGHAWVKRRFVPAEWKFSDPAEVVSSPGGRYFIPARVRDNPAINEEEYRGTLSHLPPIARTRIMDGDWNVAENLQIPADWFKYFTMRGAHLIPLDRDGIDERLCKRFATIDTAGTSRDKADEQRGKPPSWSVCAIWDYWPATDLLFLRYVWRDRVAWNELKLRIAEVLRTWNVRTVRIENAHVGPPLASELARCGDVQLVGPMLPGMADGHRGAKLERAIASGFLSRLEAGKIVLPQEDSPWKSAYEHELTAWDGTPEATCDQIDVSSYGAWHVRTLANQRIIFDRQIGA